jgi:hypothetical protein
MLNPCRIRSDYRELRYHELDPVSVETQIWAKPLTLLVCGFMLGVFLYGTTVLAKDNKPLMQVKDSRQSTQ